MLTPKHLLANWVLTNLPNHPGNPVTPQGTPGYWVSGDLPRISRGSGLSIRTPLRSGRQSQIRSAEPNLGETLTGGYQIPKQRWTAANSPLAEILGRAFFCGWVAPTSTGDSRP